MNNINFTIQDNFPVSQETFDFLQEMIKLNHKLSKIGGTNYILEGCDVNNDDTVNNGFICIDGEVMPFAGGNEVKTYIEIVENREAVEAFGTNYLDAYVKRYAQLSDVDNGIEFVSYMQVESNVKLLEKINEKSGSPVGVIEDWAGLIDKIPSNYILCDGRALYKAQYPDLYNAIGETYGVIGTTQFKLPDMQGRVSVGYSSLGGDYEKIGAIGGAETVELLENNLPAHTHGAETDSNGSHNHNMFVKADADNGDLQVGDERVSNRGVDEGSNDYIMQTINNGVQNAGKTSTDGSHDHNVTVFPTGGNEAHENRMPYMVLPKIIKARY